MPKIFFSSFTFNLADIFAPIIAPAMPHIAILIPIFQLINFVFIDTIIAEIDVGTKNTKDIVYNIFTIYIN